jgi:hypothetical protein
VYDIVLGSRILGGGALSGGMPRHKYIANRMLTLVQNLALGAKLSEYHTGFRAYSRELLMSLPLEANSEDFVFEISFLPSAFVSEPALAKFPALPVIFLKPLPSISGAARSTVSAF